MVLPQVVGVETDLQIFDNRFTMHRGELKLLARVQRLVGGEGEGEGRRRRGEGGKGGRRRGEGGKGGRREREEDEEKRSGMKSTNKQISK
jgi:hypothetical protein